VLNSSSGRSKSGSSSATTKADLRQSKTRIRSKTRRSKCQPRNRSRSRDVSSSSSSRSISISSSATTDDLRQSKSRSRSNTRRSKYQRRNRSRSRDVSSSSSGRSRSISSSATKGDDLRQSQTRARSKTRRTKCQHRNRRRSRGVTRTIHGSFKQWSRKLSNPLQDSGYRTASTARGRSRISSSSHGKVTVGMAKRSSGKRVRDKKLACFVCRKRVLWLSRHLSKAHSDHFMVAQVMSKIGVARKHGWQRLKNLGSFKHNVRVLKRRKGEIIVVRRSSGKLGADQYLPCTRCYGFYYKYDLWRHRCPCNSPESSTEETTRSGDILDNSRSLLEGAVSANKNIGHIDEHLKKHVLKHMRDDKTSSVIRSDTLILQFGSAQLKRIGIKGQRRIATRMRILARLLQTLRTSLDLPSKSLSYFLDSAHFDAVVEAVETMSGLHSDKNGQRVLKTPSIALLVGNVLPKCCNIKKGVAIRKGDDENVKEVENFMTLFTTDYSDSMSCPALSTLKTKRYNKPDELPSTEDLMKLKEFTETQMCRLTQQLKTEQDYSSWRQLAEIVLTRLVVFNKRRASEPARLELSQYLNRPDWHRTSNQEVLGNLKPLEKKLMERMDLIQVPGKRNRKVPILITPEVGKAMQMLANTRAKCGISPRNRYFFATDSSNGYLNTWLVLHNNAVAAGVNKPRLITSGRLRKYVATLAQVIINIDCPKQC